MDASTERADGVQVYNIGRLPVEYCRDEVAVLHWCLRAIKHTHPSFRFLVGCLRHSVEYGGCTDHQLAVATRIMRSIFAELMAEFGE